MPAIVKIGDRWVGEGERCFVIAEAGANHNLPRRPDLAAAVEHLSRNAARRGELPARGRALVNGRDAARVAVEPVRALPAPPSAGPARGSR